MDAVADFSMTSLGDQMSEKKAFLDAWEREAATTMKLLRAYPGGKETLKPHDTCRNAKELAWTFAFEGAAAAQAVKGEFKFPPANMPTMPDTWQGTVGEIERVFKKMAQTGFPVADAERHDPSPRAVLRLLAHGGRQGPLDLWAVQGRAVAVRL